MWKKSFITGMIAIGSTSSLWAMEDPDTRPSTALASHQPSASMEKGLSSPGSQPSSSQLTAVDPALQDLSKQVSTLWPIMQAFSGLKAVIECPLEEAIAKEYIHMIFPESHEEPQHISKGLILFYEPLRYSFEFLTRLHTIKTLILAGNKLKPITLDHLTLQQIPLLTSLYIFRGLDEGYQSFELTSLCVHDMPALKEIEAHSCGLKQLSLKNLPALEKIGLSSNNLTKFALPSSCAQKIKEINVAQNDLECFELGCIPEAIDLNLHGNPRLKKLDFHEKEEGEDAPYTTLIRMVPKKDTKVQQKPLPRKQKARSYHSRRKGKR